VKISKEFKVGLMAVISGAILYIGFNFLKGSDLFSHNNTYYAVYNKVDGLAPSNPVTINGYPVGRVKSLKLLQNRSDSVLVALDISKDIQIGDSSFAMIAKDLLGGMSIILKMNHNTKIYQNGDTIKGSFQPSIGEILEDIAYPVVEHIDTTIVRLNRLIDNNMRKKLYGTISNFEAISSDFKVTMRTSKDNLGQMVTNMNTLSSQLLEDEKQLKPILQKFSALADSLNDIELKQTVDHANVLLAELNKSAVKISKGEGTMGALINDKSVYDNLNKTLVDLDSLLKHFDKNPRYFLKPLGTKPKP
jgi:phospholipid/cholesterol/gamma-HCH transport system substrate-binding protein